MEVLQILKDYLLSTDNEPELAKTIISYLEKCEMCDKLETNLKEQSVKSCWRDDCDQTRCGNYKKICKKCYRENHCNGCQDVFLTRVRDNKSSYWCQYCYPKQSDYATDKCAWRIRWHSRFSFSYAQTWHKDYGWIAVHTLKARLAGYPPPYITHHKDENPLNNSDKNLQFMFQGDHVRLHRRGGSASG